MADNIEPLKDVPLPGLEIWTQPIVEDREEEVIFEEKDKDSFDSGLEEVDSECFGASFVLDDMQNK